MILLGIETSCDETAAAVFLNGELRANIITLQDIHLEFGGVVPEYASRAHQRLVLPAITSALKKAEVTISDLDGIAVTYGPGLIGSLLVGLNVAKGMALGLNIPWIGVNHMEGHLFANFVREPFPEFPFICLIISGGHTQLVLVKNLGDYTIVGSTIDDAAGETFDKVARMLGLNYPGGPAIQKAAEGGDPDFISFPRAMMEKGNLDFSFSGLKTAVLYYIQQQDASSIKKNLQHITASFEQAVVEVLVKKTMRVAAQYNISSIALAGGVAANKRLRKALSEELNRKDYKLYFPEMDLCTDNAAMIARAGLFYLQQGIHSSFDLAPQPSLSM